MNFKKLQLEDRDLFLKYLGEYKFYTYEYSFTTLYLWRNYLNIEFALNDDYIVVRKHHSTIGSYFMEPIGYKDENLKEIVENLNTIKREDNMDYLFRNVETPFLNKLIGLFGDRVYYKEDENNFDYIYNTKDLATLSGKKYKKRRNRYNTFLNKYKNCYFRLGNGNEERKIDCEALAKKWYMEYDNNSEETYYELKGVKDLLDNFEALNIKYISVYDNDKIIGFAIGEAVNKDYALIHIEKCCREYVGIYEYINKTFIKECFINTKFVNRGEDLGKPGLRKAKMEYNPTKLGKKYIINLK